MKLLLVGSFAQSLLNFRGALIEDLQKAGVEVHVAAPGLAQGRLHRALKDLGVITHDISLQRTGMNPWADLKSWYCLWRLMRHLQPDVFLGYTIKPVIYGLFAARFARVPRRYALITGLGFAFHGQPGSGRARMVSGIAHRLYRLALKGADRVFFQNPDDQALFVSLGILSPRAPSQVVNGSGVDIQHFAKAPVPEGPVVFLLIARLLVAKGVREYAQAANKLRQGFPHSIFRLAGWIDDGPDAIGADELNAWVNQGTLEYMGKLEDVRPALRDCSVYVLPSYREGTPRTVLEAMSIGRAVITTDAPGCRETVVDGRNGYLVPVASSEKIAEAMEKFLMNPDLIRVMGQQSREIAEEKYDVRLVNAQMLRGMGITA